MPPFNFKKFTIHHDNSSMKVGTDGVLLGAWTNVNDAQQILDIGTGCGLIALMLAQRTSEHTVIDAIDIDSNSVNEARSNFQASPWNSKLNVFEIAAQNLLIDQKYGLIVSNPPFFINSEKAPKLSRSNARHTDMLSQEELIESVLNLITDKGRFCVIWPTAEGENFAALAMAFGLHLTRVTEVIPNPGKAPERLLMEFKNGEKETMKHDQLVIELDQRHKYSKEYESLTKDFYLFF